MENKSCITLSEAEATCQESSQKFKIAAENNSHNGVLANDHFRNNSMYPGCTRKDGYLSEFQLLLQKTESEINADLENLQITVKQKDNAVTGILNAIPQNIMIAVPSGDTNEVKFSGRVKIRRAFSVLSNEDKAPTSILTAASKDSKYKLSVDPQLKSLKDEVTTLIKQCIAQVDTIISFEKRLANSEKSRSELHKKCLTLELEEKKLKKLIEETTDKYNSVQLELYSAKWSMDEEEKSKKVEMANKSDMAKQFALILAQRDKLSTELQDLKYALGDSQANRKKVIQDLKSEYKVAITSANSEKFRSELQKNCSTSEQEEEQLKKLLELGTDLYNSVQLELYATKWSMDDEKKSKKVEMAAKSDIAKQFELILAQRDKLNTELQDLKYALEDLQANHREVIQDLKSEYKVTIKQKKELINVMKKQIRLANDLKRQLRHFKAAVSQIKSKKKF